MQLAYRASGRRVKGQKSRFFGLLTLELWQFLRKKYETYMSLKKLLVINFKYLLTTSKSKI